MPFAIVDRASGRVIGSTRFWKIDRKNRKLEIGHTWLSESAQRTRANTEAKWLLLAMRSTCCCVRVQFTTDELNEKSRAAILRLGAKQEDRAARTDHAGWPQAQFGALQHHRRRMAGGACAAAGEARDVTCHA